MVYVPDSLLNKAGALNLKDLFQKQLEDFKQRNAPPPTPLTPPAEKSEDTVALGFSDEQKKSLLAPFTPTKTEPTAPDSTGQPSPSSQISGLPDQIKRDLIAPFLNGGASASSPPSMSMPSGGGSGGFSNGGASSSGAPLDFSSPDAYKRSLVQNAQIVAQKYDLPANIIAAIPIQEAGYSGSDLTRRANNLFSIKGQGPSGSEHYGGVWEVENGQNVSVPADFRKYNNAAESFDDFGKLITESPRYAKAVEIWRQTRDPNAFIQAVQNAGYATDPTWAGKVAAIASEMPSASSGQNMLADNAPPPPDQPRSESRSFKGMTYSETQADPTLQSQQQIDTSSSDWGNDTPFVPNPVSGSADASQDTNPPVDAGQSDQPATSQPEDSLHPMQQFANTIAAAAQQLGSAFSGGGQDNSVRPEINLPAAEDAAQKAASAGPLKPPAEQGIFSSGLEPAATDRPDSMGIDLSQGQRPVIRSEAQVPNATGPTRDTYAQESARGNSDQQFPTFEQPATTNEQLATGVAPTSDRGNMPMPSDVLQAADNLNQAVVAPLQAETPAAVHGDARISRATDYLTALGNSDPQGQLTGIMERAGVPGHEDIGFTAGPLEVGPRELAGAALGMAIGGPGGQAEKGPKEVKALADVFHIVQHGYKRGGSETESLLRSANRLMPEIPKVTEADLAKYVADRGMSEAQASHVAQVVDAAEAMSRGEKPSFLQGKIDWSKTDPRELGAEVLRTVRESQLALDDYTAQAEKIRLDPMHATLEDKNRALDALAKTMAADQTLLGERNLASSIGLALKQFQYGADPEEIKAWQEGIRQGEDSSSRVAGGLQKVVDDAAKGKAPSQKQLDKIEREAAKVEASSEKLGGDEHPLVPREGKGPGGPQETKGGYPKAEGPGGPSKTPPPEGATPPQRKTPEIFQELARVVQQKQQAADTGDVVALHELEDQYQSLLDEARGSLVAKAEKAGVKIPKEVDPEHAVVDRIARTMQSQVAQDLKDAAGADGKPLARDVKEQIAQDITEALIKRHAPDINPATQAKQEARLASQIQRAIDRQMAKNLDAIDNMEQRGYVKGVYQRARDAAEKWLSGTIDETRSDGKVVKTVKSAQQQLQDEQEYRAALNTLKDEARTVGKPNLADDLEKSINERSARMAKKAEEAAMRKGQNDIFASGQKIIKERQAQQISDIAKGIREKVAVMRANPREVFQTGMVDSILKDIQAMADINDQGRKRSARLFDSIETSGMKKLMGKNAPIDESDRKVFFEALTAVDPKDPEAMRKFMNLVVEGSRVGMLLEYSMTSMLSSPVTQMVNLLSNVAQASSYLGFKQPIETGLLSLSGRSAGRKELGALYRGAADGLGRGLGMAAEILDTGGTTEARKRASMLADFSDVNREMLTEKFGPVGAMLHAISTRPLEAVDTIFGQTLYNAHLQALAERKAAQLTRDGTPTTGAEIIANLDKHLDLIKEAGRLSDYSLLKSPGGPSQMIADVVRRGNQRDLESGAAFWGPSAKAAFSLIVPFTKTPWNFFKQGVAYSPVGTVAKAGELALRGALGNAPEKLVGKHVLPPMSHEVVASKVADVAAGLALMTTAAGLYGMGGDDPNSKFISGDGPQDDNLRKMWMATGWQPRSIRVGDKWVSYDSLPVTIPFTTVVTALENRSTAEMKAKRGDIAGAGQDVLTAGAKGGLSAISGQSMLQSLGTAYDLARGGTSFENAGEQFGSSALTRMIPAGSLLAWAARLGDDYRRDTSLTDNPVAARIQERLPLAHSKLQPALDATGEQIKAPSNVQIAPGLPIGPRTSTLSKSDVAKTMVRYGVGDAGVPQRYKSDVTGEEKVMTAAQKRSFLQYLNMFLPIELASAYDHDTARESYVRARDQALQMATVGD